MPTEMKVLVVVLSAVLAVVTTVLVWATIGPGLAAVVGLLVLVTAYIVALGLSGKP